MTEAHPDASPEKVRLKLRRDVIRYFDRLSLPIEYIGVDCRREEGCSSEER